MGKYTEVNNDMLPKGKALNLGEIGEAESIEVVSEKNFMKTAELASFMNEIVTILVHQSSEDGALDFAPVQVNGLNQPMLRGAESKVKRKYVEALARTRTTKYVQQVIDPTRPENIQMKELCTLTYPFAVIHDPSGDFGRRWLEEIVNTP